MKKIFLFILSFSMAVNVSLAQTSLFKKADRYYNRLQYVKAAETYEKIVSNGFADEHVIKNLADIYYRLSDTKNAEKYYAKLVTRTKDPEIYYRYAQILKANGKYEESIPWMEKFVQMKPNDERAAQFKNNPQYLPKILERGKGKFVVKPLPNINTEYSDFGAKPLSQKLYFVSARDTKNKKYGWDQQPYLDIYQSDYVNGVVSNIEKLPGDVNTKYHEGTFCFTPDGKTMYFTRDNFNNDKYVTDSIGVGRLKLYSAQKVNDVWVNIKELPFNNDNYSVGHPAVSPDGKKLYFSSDMPGGKGQSDLYVVDIKGHNQFGKPVNLGPKINTEGRENFPFISKNGDLYFSSDGHLGLGGLDVFVCKNMNGTFAKPRNLGTPLNSGRDDFAIYIDDDTKNGFISSNRSAKRIGDDDIYTIKNVKPVCDVLVSVTIRDVETKKPIAEASVSLIDEEGKPLKSKLVADNGNVEFLVNCGEPIHLEARAENYENNTINIEATDTDEVSVEIALKSIKNVITIEALDIHSIYFDINKSNIRKDAAFELDKIVQAMLKYPEMKIHIIAHTDKTGLADYNQKLSEKRAQATMAYIVSKGVDASRISAEGKGESEPAVNCTRCTEKQNQLNRRAEIIIIEEKDIEE